MLDYREMFNYDVELEELLIDYLRYKKAQRERNGEEKNIYKQDGQSFDKTSNGWKIGKGWPYTKDITFDIPGFEDYDQQLAAYNAKKSNMRQG